MTHLEYNTIPVTNNHSNTATHYTPLTKPHLTHPRSIEKRQAPKFPLKDTPPNKRHKTTFLHGPTPKAIKSQLKTITRKTFK